MPDIFIPIDTTRYSSFYSEMVRKGIISSYTLNFMEHSRNALKSRYFNIESFKKDFVVNDDILQGLIDYAHKEGVKDSVDLQFSKRMEQVLKANAKTLDSLYTNATDLQSMEAFEKLIAEEMKKSYSESMNLRNLDKVEEFLVEGIMFEFARNLFSFGEAYQIYLQNDATFKQAVSIMQDPKVFKKFKADI